MMQTFKQLRKWGQQTLDKLVPYTKERWIVLLVCCSYVLWRIVVYDFQAILFFWGLYILYLGVLYYTPSGFPDPDQDTFSIQPTEVQESEEAPINLFQAYEAADDRPLLRSITEYTLWKSIMLTVLICWVCTFSELFAIPVYWPFLLIYFIWLIGLAFRNHYKHMRKYNYSLRDFLKKNEEVVGI